MEGDIYIDMAANHCPAEFMDRGNENIFISRDAKLFMKEVSLINCDNIYESLKKDSIYIDEDDEKEREQIEKESSKMDSAAIASILPSSAHLNFKNIGENANTMGQKQKEKAATTTVTSNFQTHPNFKSIYKNVQNADTINNQVGDAIINQKYF